METELYTVCPVLVTRRYGGPEEGGWYWDHLFPLYRGRWANLVKVFTDYEEAVIYGNEVSEALAIQNEGLPPLHSVMSTGIYGVEIYEGFPKETATSHYE